MGDSLRDHIKSRKHASRRAGQAVAAQAAVEARAQAIRERNRKKTAHAAQYEMRLNGIDQKEGLGRP